AGRDHRRVTLETLLLQDRPNFSRRGLLVAGEMDLEDRAAGEVDRELEPLLAAGQEGQDDEYEARNCDEQAEGVEPAPLADDVKHGRWPRASPCAARRPT